MQVIDLCSALVIVAWLTKGVVLLSKRLLADGALTEFILRSGVICSGTWLLFRMLKAGIPIP